MTEGFSSTLYVRDPPPVWWELCTCIQKDKAHATQTRTLKFDIGAEDRACTNLHSSCANARRVQPRHLWINVVVTSTPTVSTVSCSQVLLTIVWRHRNCPPTQLTHN